MEIDMTEQQQNHYMAVPPSGRGPGVLVLHAWWGLNDFMRDFCQRLAREGFVALAPDLYHGKIARTIAEAEQLSSNMDQQVTATDILSALESLRRLPAVAGSGLGTIGFSLGGYWALWLAQQKPQDIRAVTVFYGTGHEDHDESTAAYQGHFAANDPYEPESAVQELEKGLMLVKRPTSFYTYEQTGHWFFEQDREDAYNAPAAQLAWERTVAFLHERLDRE
jgi:carboxymethylenebutenolidase